MAPYRVVFQLLALVQWRARAQAHYACTQLPSVSHSGSQAEPDWQWIRVRVCPADSGADLCDCQWPSPGHNAARLQLPSGQLGLNNCISASDGQQFISSNLKLRPTWKFPPETWNLAAATATSPCAGSRPSPFSWTTVPTDRPARWRWRGRRRWSGWKLAPPTRTIPPRRCHDIGEHIMKSVISHGCDIRIYWYQGAISWLICSDFMWLIIIYWYHSRFHTKCIWYRIWYAMKIAQETVKLIWYCMTSYNIMEKTMISCMIS